ncbi:hypothetical protein [Methylobacterium sp. J-090]|uniref:hypothetical protein n=1 Tax=Methylobacterium sp. J-090 TaxID=2836666 RepID=UPI001FB9138A|nr:hypothetical protein [Methylobacterium sp. J-090]MCJ2082800.1 hypothetical protein [Methylobacterium sp. J-090]
MSHPFSRRPDWTGLCDELFGFGTGTGLDEVAGARLRGYVQGLGPAARNDDSIWSDYAGLYGESLAQLASDDAVAAAQLVERLYATPLTHGFLQGHLVHESLTTNPAARLHVGRIILDRFVRLSEAVGAGRVQSREHGQTHFVIEALDVLMAAIEKRIGFDLAPPQQAGDLFGLRLAKGIYSDRHFDGIYGAWRAHRIARDFGFESPSLLEIGGGSGHLAYYATCMGCNRFAIVDLPPVLVPQYILLSTAFGPDAVSFGYRTEPGITLANAYGEDVGRFMDWDVVINIDSMPEMAPADAGRYLDRIRRGGLFLSINQESAVQNGDHRQNVVADLARERGFRCHTRMAAWLRTGWVEEVFQAP